MNDTLKRITVDPAICHGKPTVRGLRYPVSMILELLAGNMTPEEILADYPDLEREDISACLAFAARISTVHQLLELPNQLRNLQHSELALLNRDNNRLNLHRSGTDTPQVVG